MKALVLGLRWRRVLNRGFLGSQEGLGRPTLGAGTGKAMGIIGFPVAAHSKDPNYL